MTSRGVTIAGYLLVLAAGLVIQLLGRRSRAGVLPLGDVLTRIMRTRTGRVGILVFWAWLGLHFFAR
jgi:Family of unknown function (DUF6186)